MSENEMIDITKEVAKEIAKDAYNDAGKPIAKPTGELMGLVPRAIKAALSPLEQWILQKEYNVAETKRLLEKKLENISPDLIESPEPYIAVPTLQYISYCMDNEELRDMYANLLANSMNKVVKNGVHPGFVEIIKQLSPDEAKILRYLHSNPLVPVIGIRVHKKPKGTVVVEHLFTNITELCGCENIGDYQKYVDNLTRLGLVNIPQDECLSDKRKYETLTNHPYILRRKSELEILESVSKVDFVEGHIELTHLGTSFCSICLETHRTVVGDVEKGKHK
ncbi:MAG: DUF4393 domain-containing protein [Ruminococcaceae bacterium]|nr:DUF4393 domain-containing protein [Oscillospiraceae bacterium]